MGNIALPHSLEETMEREGEVVAHVHLQFGVFLENVDRVHDVENMVEMEIVRNVGLTSYDTSCAIRNHTQ